MNGMSGKNKTAIAILNNVWKLATCLAALPGKNGTRSVSNGKQASARMTPVPLNRKLKKASFRPSQLEARLEMMTGSVEPTLAPSTSGNTASMDNTSDLTNAIPMMIMAALLCMSAVNSIPINANNNGLVEISDRNDSISELSLNGSKAPVILPIPKKMNPMLSAIEPIFFINSFLMNKMRITPRKMKMEAYLATSNVSTWTVSVVPIADPSTTPKACPNVITEPPTSPTINIDVTVLLCKKKVTTIPLRTPFIRVLVMVVRNSRIFVAASRCNALLSKCVPYRNIPSPPRNAKIVENMI